MKKLFYFAAVAILAAGLAFTGCDLLESPDGPGSTEETYSPLTIQGQDTDGKTVEIIFSTKRTFTKQVLTPASDDTYAIKKNGAELSAGDIKVASSEITFNPKSGASSPFKATYSGGKLAFDGNTIPLDTPVGFKPIENNVTNTTAEGIAKILGSNAEVNGNDVVISGTVTVRENLEIPAGIKLIFNTREKDQFLLDGEKKVEVTAKGGIEVRSNRAVQVVDNNKNVGRLIVERDSTINGTLSVADATTMEIASGATVTIGNRGNLNIEGGATLNVLGNVTIDNGGTMLVTGDATRETVNDKYIKAADTTQQQKTKTDKKDGILKGGSGSSLVIKNGGTLLIPDPSAYDLGDVKSEITVQAGGQVIALTVEPPDASSATASNGSSDTTTYKPRSAPLIGTTSTAVDNFLGADFVMEPGADSKIVITVKQGDPELTLVGKAVALGAVNYSNVTAAGRDKVWLTYKFTVDDNSVLEVGGTTKWFSEVRVTGSQFTVQGRKSGQLINRGKILIYGKQSGAQSGSGIIKWYNGVFTDNKRVYRQEDNTRIEEKSSTISFLDGSGSKITGMNDENCVYWWCEDEDKPGYIGYKDPPPNEDDE